MIILFAIAMAGAQSCQKAAPKTDVGSIYSALKQANLEPKSIELAADGDGVMLWEPAAMEDSGAVYYNIKAALITYFDNAMPQEYEYIYPGAPYRQEECWAFADRTILLSEDSARGVKLSIIIP